MPDVLSFFARFLEAFLQDSLRFFARFFLLFLRNFELLFTKSAFFLLVIKEDQMEMVSMDLVAPRLRFKLVDCLLFEVFCDCLNWVS